MRLKLMISYDGSEFCGWQSQARGRSIQRTLEEAISQVCGVPIRLHGSGRTDAGVHALGQIAHFDTQIVHAPDVWLRALNHYLPDDVRVIKVGRATHQFHARFSARGKIYEYRIWNHPISCPLNRNLAWHVPQLLNIDEMKRAALILVGKHDFKSFCARRGNGSDEDTIRSLTRITVKKSRSDLCIRFEGEGFLYKMVRMLVAGLVEVGLEKITSSDLQTLLDHPSQNKKAQRRFVAPAQGLYLMRVHY